MGQFYRLIIFILFGFITCCYNACAPYSSSNIDQMSSNQNSNEELFKASNFLDTGAGNSLNEDDSLFDFTNSDGLRVLTTSSNLTNIHSHLNIGYDFSNFIYSGRMMHAEDNGGIGITFLSQYPNSDAYYRLRRYEDKKYFHIEAHSNSACNGKRFADDTKKNVWYHFRVVTLVEADQTSFEIQLWEEGDYVNVQTMSCTDSSSERFESGTIGVWSMGSGEKYWADMGLLFDPFGGTAPQQSTTEEPTTTPPVEGPSTEEPSTEEPEPTPDPMVADYVVSSAATLNSAMSSAQVGQSIELQSGSYGSLSISKSGIKIFARSSSKAVISNLNFNSQKDVEVSGLFIEKRVSSGADGQYLVRLTGSGNILRSNHISWSSEPLKLTQDQWLSQVGSGISASGSNHRIENNKLIAVDHGIMVTAAGSTIRGNSVDMFRGDGMHGRADNLLFEFNTIQDSFDVDSNHDDGFQSYTASNGTTEAGRFKNVVLRGNRIIQYTDPNRNFIGALQGIGMFDGIYENWTIDSNLIVVQHWHGISVYGVDGIKIINNTVMPMNPNITPGPPWIKVSNHKNGTAPTGTNIVKNNVTMSLQLVSGIQSSYNVVLKTADLNTHFVDANNHDYRLKESSSLINGGSNTLVGIYDVSKNARISDKVVDIGALEYQFTEPTPTPTPTIEPEPELPQEEELPAPPQDTFPIPSSSEISIKNAAELTLALKSVKGGEVILLEDGSYGNLDISSKNYSSNVTIAAKNSREAVFSNIKIDASSNVQLLNLKVSSGANGSSASKIVQILNSNHIQVKGCEVHGLIDNIYSGYYGIYSYKSSFLTLTGNYVHDIKIGFVTNTITDLIFTENTVDYTGSDSYKFERINRALIENNTGSRMYFPEPGAHLDFMQFRFDSTNVTLRGNVSLPANQPNIQGLFLNDGNYSNILIENNVIATSMMRGISISNSTDVMARYNTVIRITSSTSKAAKVMGATSVYKNIQTSYVGDKNGVVGETLTIQVDSPDKPYYADTIYKNATRGLGLTIQDLKPIPGSLAESYGAFERINELMRQ